MKNETIKFKLYYEEPTGAKRRLLASVAKSYVAKRRPSRYSLNSLLSGTRKLLGKGVAK